MDTDSFALGVSTKDIIKHLKNTEHIFDCSNLNETHEFFSKKKQKSFW